MNLGKILENILSNNNIIGTISSVLIIILIGFIFTKKKILSEVTAENLSKIILFLAIPALSYNAFMQDMDSEKLNQSMSLLIWSIVIHLALIFISSIIFKKYGKSKKDVLRMITIFGSTTVFGIPVIQAVYGDLGAMYASVFNLPYRALLYTYGYITISEVKLKKENIGKIISNPVIVATFLGMGVWIFQKYLPQISINENGIIRNYGILRIDKTAYWLFKPMQYLAALNAPLSWLSIGITLAGVPLDETLKSKISWKYSILKVSIIPMILISIFVGLKFIAGYEISYIAVATIIIMMATPAATVIATYAINFRKEPLLVSSCSLASSILAVLMIPAFIVLIEILREIGIFI
ncbi:AEC family transporter [uncultured Fusobacterium sp.]|jgi:predicted permease|uniref:AEC family transporter n=1 Tax=uncultured Fusobacterium sp. TaxID=159267 RepID=UPI0015A5ACE8|nr:AEC family transporter [uncultured Fusobacterium sp.]